MTVHSLSTLFDGEGAPLLALLGLWATVVLAFAWLTVKSLRRVSPAVRYCIWQCALTSLLVLPVLVLLLPGIPLGFSLGSASRESKSLNPQSVLDLRSFSGPPLDEADSAMPGPFPDESGG